MQAKQTVDASPPESGAPRGKALPHSPTTVSRPRQNRFATRIGLERCKTSTVLSPAFGSSLDRIGRQRGSGCGWSEQREFPGERPGLPGKHPGERVESQCEQIEKCKSEIHRIVFHHATKQRAHQIVGKRR